MAVRGVLSRWHYLVKLSACQAECPNPQGHLSPVFVSGGDLILKMLIESEQKHASQRRVILDGIG